MRRFIKYSILFALPILLVGVVFEIFLRKIPNDYAYKRGYLDKHSNELRILFLGNSHFYFGINPEFIGQHVFNASHVSQSLDYDYAILDKYKDRIEQLQCIVLPVDYFSLFTTLETSVEDWRVKNYRIYYGLYKGNVFRDNFEIFSTLPKDNMERCIQYYSKNKSSVSCTELGWGFEYLSSKSKNLDTTGMTAANRHTIKTDKYFDHNVAVLNRLISFAKPRNIKIVFVTSPASSAYVKHLDRVQLNRTIQQMQTLADNKDVFYLNLLTESSFLKEDFYDADHLNEKGAQKFSILIGNFVEESLGR